MTLGWKNRGLECGGMLIHAEHKWVCEFPESESLQLQNQETNRPESKVDILIAGLAAERRQSIHLDARLRIQKHVTDAMKSIVRTQSADKYEHYCWSVCFDAAVVLKKCSPRSSGQVFFQKIAKTIKDDLFCCFCFYMLLYYNILYVFFTKF